MNTIIADYQIVPARSSDCDDVVALFGALHSYNAALDPLFVLADGWQDLLTDEFESTYLHPEKLWLLAKAGDEAVGLLIAAVHTDSPLFKYRQWVEVEGLYVAPTHRRMGIADELLSRAYAWADEHGLDRVQLFMTASNGIARWVYENEGFSMTQAIMRKRLSA